MKKRSMVAVLSAVVVTGSILAGQARAQGEEGWQFEVTPYIWAAGLEGDVTLAGREVDFEKDASDLFDALEFGASVRIGAEYNRILIGGLFDYFSLSTDELDVEDQPRGGGSLDTDLTMIEGMIGYRVDGWSEGQSFGICLGVRSLNIENELKGIGGMSVTRDNTVTDAMVYLLPSVPVLPSKIDGLRFNPVLGVGAGDSDLAYELFPQFQYQITENLAARLGYRRVGWKYKGDNNEDNELNISLAGLIAGLGMTF